MKQKVIFRADGNSEIGLGHVLRLVALADLLQSEFVVCFAIQQPTAFIQNLLKPLCSEIISLPATHDYEKEAHTISTEILTGKEIFVLDGYYFKTTYQETIKTHCKKLVYIDDLHGWHQCADVIINHADGVIASDYSSESYTQFYLGLKYALLRKEFFEPKFSRPRFSKIDKVFLSMGGADIYNVTQKVIEALSSINNITNTTVLIGKVNPHSAQIFSCLKDKRIDNMQIKSNLSASELFYEISTSQLAICPASNTALEACAVGIGMISGFTAENQLDILKGLDRNNCIENLGDLTTVSIDKIRSAILGLTLNMERVKQMIAAQKKLIDGKSPERLIQIFNKLAYA